MLLLEPVKPVEPLLPIPPDETILQRRTLYTFSKLDVVSLAKLNNLIPKGFSAEDVIIQIEYDHYCDSSFFSAELYYKEEISNPNLNKEIEIYNKKMLKYEKDMEKFRNDYAQWQEEVRKYKALKKLKSKLNSMNSSEILDLIKKEVK